MLGNTYQCPFTTLHVNIRNVEYLMPACQMPKTLTGRAEHRERGGKRHTQRDTAGQSTGRQKGKDKHTQTDRARDLSR